MFGLWRLGLLFHGGTRTQTSRQRK
jgi:hypothetical protein